MAEEKPFMTEDQAEDIVMAAEVGIFRGTRSELVHAHLLLAARARRWEKEENDFDPEHDERERQLSIEPPEVQK